MVLDGAALMIHKEQLLEGDMIFVLHDFLSAEECERFIARSEEAGYGDAPISTGAGFVMRKDIRNNDRVMIDDPALAALLWERARSFMPPNWFGWEPVGLNERFRYYRYDPGQQFAPHTDGYFQRDNGERSQFTFMVYLNDGCEGGETLFIFPSLPGVRLPQRNGGNNTWARSPRANPRPPHVSVGCSAYNRSAVRPWFSLTANSMKERLSSADGNMSSAAMSCTGRFPPENAVVATEEKSACMRHDAPHLKLPLLASHPVTPSPRHPAARSRPPAVPSRSASSPSACC